MRGGKGAFGWIAALPWHNPMMLAVAFSFIMLGFGGAGGLINMSYQLDTTIHNTQWITGHFHLIFAGAIVIMYFAIAYDLWPHLTGRALDSVAPHAGAALDVVRRHDRADLPVALCRHPRHAAPHGVLRLHAIPRSRRWPSPVILSVIGGAILVVSGALFLAVLIRGPPRAARRPGPVPVQRGRAPAADGPGGRSTASRSGSA